MSESESDSAPEFAWFDLDVPHGKGWSDTARAYDRLPARAESLVPEIVWDLSRNSTGLFTRFRTDATTIVAQYTLTDAALAMTHMPATAVSGLDLYADDVEGKPRWVGVTHPATFPEVDVTIVEGLDAGTRDYTLYFPLFNSITQAAIGVPAGSTFELLPESETPPILYYGTSIIHGASASRPGMALPALLGRRLGRTVINLGFSGNGKMEVELAELIAEVDTAAYVIDCLPNMDADLVRERALPFLRALRERRPDTPILLVEDRTLANAWVIGTEREKHTARRAEIRAAYEKLIAEGDANLHYLEGANLLGDDDDATVDRSHPTDLGFTRMADILTPILSRLIQ